MTREEAIKFWKFRYENARVFGDPHWEAQERREHREYVEAIRMAIEALQGDMYCPNCGVRLVPENEYLEPTQTHGRLIDADALEKELSKRWDISDDQDFCNKEVWEALRNAPTVQADRPHGEWVEVVERTEQYDREGVKTWATLYQCSNCGFVLNAIEGHIGQYDFCPNCGADMREEKE